MSEYQEMKLADRYGGEHEDIWGGEAGSLARRAAYADRVSHHRREAQRDRIAAHRWRLLMFGIMAVPGTAMLFNSLLSVTPQGWQIVLGAILLLPWLVELGEGE